MKTTTLPLQNSMNRSLLGAFFLIVVTFACFALAPATNAQCPQICDSNDNTAVGNSALISNTTGNSNTANGFAALSSNTTGDHNTASGAFALWMNTISFGNTATGASALQSNTSGTENTATGFQALDSNTTGIQNTANGANALVFNTIGFNNTANGVGALFTNSTGNDNTANGFGTLELNTTGNNNTADGYNALINNTTGSFNIAVGNNAGANLTTGKNNIDIGNNGVAGESKIIRIGKQGTQTNTYVAGISGVTVSTGVPVIVDTTGHLGTTTSTAQFKEAIKPMDKASEAILALKPVTFCYKKDLDPSGVPQFGLVAEDVEKVNSDLVARDEQGKPYTVRYDAVNAMLLNEFLKEHREVQEQKATIAELRSALAQQKKAFQATAAHEQKQIEALTAGLHKVSAQVEASNHAQQTVVSNP